MRSTFMLSSTPTKTTAAWLPKLGIPRLHAILSNWRFCMEILSSRTLLRPKNLAQTQAFYRDTLGLAVFRIFGPPIRPAIVFFCGNGLLAHIGHTYNETAQAAQISLWMQIRDDEAEHLRLTDEVKTMLREPRT